MFPSSHHLRENEIDFAADLQARAFTGTGKKLPFPAYGRTIRQNTKSARSTTVNARAWRARIQRLMA
jgi:hypothetical protein